jgi:ER-bound oxygenase mpaB/B'/Rubber oxygenase, catalytic domain
MTNSRWTEEFLDQMRSQGDARADDMLNLVLQDGEAEEALRQKIFRVMDSNDEKPVEATFPVLANFFEASESLPSDIDADRLRRGEDVFSRCAFDGALALLAKSLPEGYQAPNLGKILMLSGDLQSHTYRRLLATLQTVVNVSTYGGFQPGGRAVITAQKLRLLHAGIRRIARRNLPDFEATYGVPVNQEDLLATVIGFSLLVIQGWEIHSVPITQDEKEDYLYLWMTYARMMGIHPPYDHRSTAYIPTDVADAEAFYAAYQRRHYVAADVNPQGVALARANLQMLKDLVPTPLKLIGFGLLPRILMYDLMGGAACAALAIPRVPAHGLVKLILRGLHGLLTLFEVGGPKCHHRLSIVLMQALIDRSYGGRVAFTLPTKMAEIRQMVYQPGVPPK